jgi:hypothetical protein
MACALWASPSGATKPSQAKHFASTGEFESLASGTLRVDAPPKTIVDDGERHVVILTIWNANAETKVYWRSPDGNAPRTTVIPHQSLSRLSYLLRSHVAL